MGEEAVATAILRVVAGASPVPPPSTGTAAASSMQTRSCVSGSALPQSVCASFTRSSAPSALSSAPPPAAPMCA